jgi:hypothetical protein
MSDTPEETEVEVGPDDNIEASEHSAQQDPEQLAQETGGGAEAPAEDE